MFTTYASRVGAHPTRYGSARAMPPRLLVVHTSEGAENGTSAEALAAYIATPRTADNVASYHYVADWDRVIPSVPDILTAYANAGANDISLSICYPGKANQLLTDWHDAASTAQHEQVARWLADKSLEYGVPLAKVTAAQIVKGARGVCGHFDITNAYHKTTHTDPGPNYPWAEVLGRANALTTPIPDDPQGDDDMPRKILVRALSGRMYATDLETYANYCTEDEGANLRDVRGFEVAPDHGPFPLSQADSSYVERMAG